MASVLVYYAHPGHSHSRVNSVMFEAARQLSGIEVVDLYAEYPRHNVDIDKEQQRLLAHDVILFQCPLFWYSTPSLIKEWIDLVLEHGFAYGVEGDKLAGKYLMLALTAAGSKDAYSPSGYQNFDLRTLLTPMEQTARLSQMRFLPPYVLFESLRAPEVDQVTPHVDGYRRLLSALRDDYYDFDRGRSTDVLFHSTVTSLIVSEASDTYE